MSVADNHHEAAALIDALRERRADELHTYLTVAAIVVTERWGVGEMQNWLIDLAFELTSIYEEGHHEAA